MVLRDFILTGRESKVCGVISFGHLKWERGTIPCLETVSMDDMEVVSLFRKISIATTG